jgi:hypothetical protein
VDGDTNQVDFVDSELYKCIGQVDMLSNLYCALLRDIYCGNELLDMRLYSEFKESMKLYMKRISSLTAYKC